MLNSTEKQFTILFVLLVLFELITAQVPSLQLAHYWAKPAIVFSLIVLVVHQRKILTSSLRVLLLLALSLSVSGDILLMFASQNEGFFIAGLVAFLMAHLCYLVLFFKQRHRETKPYLPLFLLYLYSVCFGYVISDSLGDLLIPVMVYEIVILLMASATFLRKNAVSRFSYIAVILGALFFVLSDSLLAFDKFYQPIPLSGVWIMTSYSIAQYLIVFGIMKSKTVTSHV